MRLSVAVQSRLRGAHREEADCRAAVCTGKWSMVVVSGRSIAARDRAMIVSRGLLEKMTPLGISYVAKRGRWMGNLAWRLRPYTSLDHMAMQSGRERRTAKVCRPIVTADDASNRDWKCRYNEFSAKRNMRPARGSQMCVDLGYVVVRALGRPEQMRHGCRARLSNSCTRVQFGTSRRMQRCGDVRLPQRGRRLQFDKGQSYASATNEAPEL